MSNKNSRNSSPAQHASSKLPKFLQTKSNRDRSKSVTDPGTARSSSPEVHSTPNPGKRSKFSPSPDGDDAPVIVEPARHYPTVPTSSRIGGDLPSRVSGWFSHTFTSSSNDLSLPSLLAAHTSPKSKGSALLTAAKHGKGHLDKAVRYLLDSDSTPDKCTDPIWLLGVQHPGYEPPPISSSPSSSSSIRRGSVSPTSFRSSTSSIRSSINDHGVPTSPTALDNPKHNPGANWPPVFYIDFTSRIWLTYRSHFPQPIKDGRLADLCDGTLDAASSTSSVAKKSPWHWVAGEKTWSSDSGWGCMLRTGQSLLANALIHIHLGRDWRKPPHPVLTADYATYVQILSWFLDTPTPDAPFSVHRMALAGKEFGTDVGKWFGPSVAAGAIRTLVNAYPDAGIGVATAVDGMLYQTDVHAASHGDSLGRSPRRHTKSWGDRPVLVLVGVRLGIEGVNPIYYSTIKALYTFPQSVGIAGGRPSSSYYFVGSQADNLFYLDPHHARPAIPLRPAPPGPGPVQIQQSSSEDRKEDPKKKHRKSGQHRRLPTSPSSSRTSATASSTFSYHAPTSPSPLQQQFSTDSESSANDTKPRSSPPVASSSQHHGRWRSASQPPASPSALRMSPSLSQGSAGSGTTSNPDLDLVQVHYCTAYSAEELKTFHCDRVRKMPLSGLDPSMLIGFLCRTEEDWVDLRKRINDLPRTILTIQDEPPSWPEDSDYDMGLESVSSETDDLDMDDDDGESAEAPPGSDDEEDDEDDQFFDTRSISASLSSGSRRRKDDNDTEEDVNDPVTPGPTARFEVGEYRKKEDDDIEDDWVEPSLSTPMPDDDRFTMVTKPSSHQPSPSSSSSDASASTPADAVPTPPRIAKTKSKDGVSKKKKGKKQKPVPVPAVKEAVHYPFPVTAQGDDFDANDGADEEPSYDGVPERRMHNARARDGGRTQSGGVKGILTDDLAR